VLINFFGVRVTAEKSYFLLDGVRIRPQKGTGQHLLIYKVATRKWRALYAKK